MRLLLDTSVLIDVLRARKNRRELLAELVRNQHELGTTTLNIAELYAGMRDSERLATEQLLDGLRCFDLTGVSARHAGRLKNDWSKKGRTLTLSDALIASIALEQRCVLVTDNRRDFPMKELPLFPLPH